MRPNRGGRAGILATLAVLAGVLAVAQFVVPIDRDAEAVLFGRGNVQEQNNPHNLSKNSMGIHAETETQICIFCHTPHHAISDSSLINAPLWNHKLSDATYVVNSAGDVFSNGVVGTIKLLSTPPNRPDGTSRLCLSCHDGTVAIGDVVSRPEGIIMSADDCLDPDGKLKSTCPSYIGIDLTTKHVVSIPMNKKLIDDSFANCTTGGQTTRVRYPFDSGIFNSLPDTVFLRPTGYTYGGNLGVTAGDIDGPHNLKGYPDGYSYGVQCSTCHDPHYWVDTGDPPDPQKEGYKFLVTGFDALCNACHKTCP